MWRKTKTAYQRLLAVMLVLSITIDKAGKRVRKKNCITRFHVEMVHTTLIFINPFHVNFESKVHTVAYYKRTEAEVYIYSFFNLGAIWCGSSTPPPGQFTRGERDLVPNVHEAGWAPGQICTAAENLTPTGIRSPVRPACTESLYRLRHPGPPWNFVLKKNLWWSGSMETYEFML